MLDDGFEREKPGYSHGYDGEGAGGAALERKSDTPALHHGNHYTAHWVNGRHSRGTAHRPPGPGPPTKAGHQHIRPAMGSTSSTEHPKNRGYEYFAHCTFKKKDAPNSPSVRPVLLH